MKPRTGVFLIGLSMLVYFCSSHTASAFYDPGTQRWLNRDPIEENGGNNLYRMVRDDPIDLLDIHGLSDADCKKCVEDLNRCMTFDAIGLGGGAGGVIGIGIAGPHHGPKGHQRPASRCGNPTEYGRGIGNGVKGGIYGIVFVAVAKCFAEHAGCMSGCQPDDHPKCMNEPPNCFENAPPSSVSSPMRR